MLFAVIKDTAENNEKNDERAHVEKKTTPCMEALQPHLGKETSVDPRKPEGLERRWD